MLGCNDAIVAMRSDGIPGKQLDQLCRAAWLGVRSDAGEVRDISQKRLRRAKSIAKLIHAAVVVALGKATPVGGDEQRHVGIVRVRIAQ